MLAAVRSTIRPRLAALGLPRARSRRVVALLAAVVTLSAADLYLTLMMLSEVGFAEENPVARAVMSLGSPVLLGAWKLFTVALATVVFLRLRRHAAAEVGAWAGLAIMAFVMLHWHLYVAETDVILRSLPVLEQGADARWMAFSPAR